MSLLNLQHIILPHQTISQSAEPFLSPLPSPPTTPISVHLPHPLIQLRSRDIYFNHPLILKCKGNKYIPYLFSLSPIFRSPSRQPTQCQPLSIKRRREREKKTRHVLIYPFLLPLSLPPSFHSPYHTSPCPFQYANS